MKTIKEIKKYIEAELTPEFGQFGLERAKESVFCRKEGDITKIVEISFLSKKDASYFGSTTASFSIRFGGLYQKSESEHEKDFPAEYFCQIRGQLNRDFKQKAPNPSLSSKEYKRRDIWWVENSDEVIELAVEGAKRVINAQLGIWLDRLSDRDYLCNLLYNEEEKMEKGLWGFGRKGSPARIKAIKQICSSDGISLHVKKNNSFISLLGSLLKKVR